MIRTLVSRVLRTVGVALPVVAILCCAGTADAGCGDYIHIVSPDGQATSPTGQNEVPDRPCHGPECTGGPRAPAPVPPAPTVSPTDVKALVADHDIVDAAAPGRRTTSDAADRPVRRPTSIYHPPRAS